MAYKFDRQELEDSIQKLADTYPKCFFVTPPLRRPLKKNIVADLQKDGIAIPAELIDATVNWYQSHISYQYNLQTGAKCLDLDGKEVGTVTELEQRAARMKILEIKERRAERAPLNPIRTMSNLVTAGRISEGQLKKIDAPMSRPTIQPELTPLYEAILAANCAMSAPMGNSDVRAAVTAAVIGVVIAEAQRILNNSKTDSAAQGCR
jgi:sRNA-binding protein